jgi:hypothetical protein
MGNTQIKKLNKLNNTSACIAYDNEYGYNLCNQPYALCTSAQCTASLQDPNIVICNCPIENGCSMGKTNCSALQPFSANGIDYIYSTYNPSQFFERDMNLYQYPNKYNNSTQFADCLDQVCIIDPSDPTSAFCQCPLISDNDKWVALGNAYNIDPDIYLSGAPYNIYQSSRNFFIPFGVKIPKRPVNAR